MTDRHRLNSVGRFSDRAADYVRYRPTYPAQLIDAMLDGLGPPSSLAAADVGAGTGISARLLADRGVRVVAVEPGAEMRGAATPHPHVSWIGGRAEALPFLPGTFDLVLCAQAFHWFHPADALHEFARVLKHGGRLVIAWNRRSQHDVFTSGYRQAIVDAGADTSAESLTFNPDVVTRSGVFSPPERRAFPNLQHLDLDGLIGRARSASYVPIVGPPAERLVTLLRSLHERHQDANGFVTLCYDTEVYHSIKL